MSPLHSIAAAGTIIPAVTALAVLENVALVQQQLQYSDAEAVWNFEESFLKKGYTVEDVSLKGCTSQGTDLTQDPKHPIGLVLIDPKDAASGVSQVDYPFSKWTETVCDTCYPSAGKADEILLDQVICPALKALIKLDACTDYTARIARKFWNCCKGTDEKDKAAQGRYFDDIPTDAATDAATCKELTDEQRAQRSERFGKDPNLPVKGSSLVTEDSCSSLGKIYPTGRTTPLELIKDTGDRPFDDWTKEVCQQCYGSNSWMVGTGKGGVASNDLNTRVCPALNWLLKHKTCNTKDNLAIRKKFWSCCKETGVDNNLKGETPDYVVKFEPEWEGEQNSINACTNATDATTEGAWMTHNVKE